MRMPIALSALFILAGAATPAAVVAQQGGADAQAPEAEQSGSGPEVLERDSEGRAKKVRLNGRVYKVCTPDQMDGCINPRDAGLEEGNREIDYWPGKPASEIEEPLPVEKPEGAKTPDSKD